MSVRVPDERLDEQQALLDIALTWVPDPYRVPARDAVAALVADLRAARADNQRLRKALVDLHESLFIGSERGLSSDTLASMATFAKTAALAEEPRA